MKKLNPNYEEQKEVNQSKWGSWQYNVRDQFKSFSTDEIKETLKQDRLPCAILMQNIEGDFNFGNIVRTSNNFNVSEIFYYGKKKWDRRAAAGTYHYSSVIHLSSLEEVVQLKTNYRFVALENNVEGCVPIKSFNYPDNPIFLFGEENGGLSSDLIKMADFTVEIPSRGSVRSLNVGSAAAIVLYDFYAKSNIAC